MSLDKLKNLLQHHACFSGSCDHKSTKECFYKIFQDGYETCEYIVGTISDSRVSNLNEENDRLKKIIAKELSENDEFGSEFVMINILKDKLRVAKETLKFYDGLYVFDENFTDDDCEQSMTHSWRYISGKRARKALAKLEDGNE